MNTQDSQPAQETISDDVLYDVSVDETLIFNDDKTAVLVTTRVPVPLTSITNALVGVIETSISNEWLVAFDYVEDEPYRAARVLGANPVYADENFWADGGRAKITHDDPQGGADTETTFGLADLADALATMALASPDHFNDLLTENDDAITHDALLQYLCYGEIVYG